jgi:hypothetical protein
MKVGRTSYSVKTHLVSCKFAKSWTNTYLSKNRKPPKFSCTKYNPKQTRIRFRCYRGDKDFFAVRR